MVSARDRTVKAGMEETLRPNFKIPTTSGLWSCPAANTGEKLLFQRQSARHRDAHCVQGVSLINLGEVLLLLHAEQQR